MKKWIAIFLMLAVFTAQAVTSPVEYFTIPSLEIDVKLEIAYRDGGAQAVVDKSGVAAKVSTGIDTWVICDHNTKDGFARLPEIQVGDVAYITDSFETTEYVCTKIGVGYADDYGIWIKGLVKGKMRLQNVWYESYVHNDKTMDLVLFTCYGSERFIACFCKNPLTKEE